MEEKPKLLDQVRKRIRFRHYSRRTEKSYVNWVQRFVIFNGMRHPLEMGAPEVETYLSYLANEKKVSPSTQNQALSALLFLYKQVLGVDLPWLTDLDRAKRSRRIPVVLTRSEIGKILGLMHGTNKLIASLLYGSGLRLMEGLRLRVKDIDFEYQQIIVRDGKGKKIAWRYCQSH